MSAARRRGYGVLGMSISFNPVDKRIIKIEPKIDQFSAQFKFIYWITQQYEISTVSPIVPF